MPTTKAKYKVKTSSHREDGVDYMKGDTIETDKDLVLLFGAEKFEHISGTPSKNGRLKPINPKELFRLNAKAHAAPGGQVHDGKQKATTGTDDDGSLIQGSTVLQPEEDETSPTTAKNNKDDGDEDEDGDSVDFHAMTIPDLQEYAKKNKIDLKGVKTKADIIEAIEDAEG